MPEQLALVDPDSVVVGLCRLVDLYRRWRCGEAVSLEASSLGSGFYLWRTGEWIPSVRLQHKVQRQEPSSETFLPEAKHQPQTCLCGPPSRPRMNRLGIISWRSGIGAVLDWLRGPDTVLN